MENLYMGEEARYWLELQKQAKINNTNDLIREMALLRAKVSFYESRIKEMDNFKTIIANI